MKIRPKKLVLPVLLAAVLILVVVWSAMQATVVEIGTVGRGTIRSFVDEEGRTRVVERFEISSPVSGRLLRVECEEGDVVAKGDLLAEIDPLSLASRVAEAEARVKAIRHRSAGVGRRRPKDEEIARSKKAEELAAANLEVARVELAAARSSQVQAKRDAERARDLFAEGTIAAAEREETELAETDAQETLSAREALLTVRGLEREIAALNTKLLVDSAVDLDWEERLYGEQIAEVEAGLRVLRDNLRRVRLVAPADGSVLVRRLESETVLAAGAPVLEVGDLAALEIEADMLSEDVAHMRKGMTVEIFGRALGDRVLKGELRQIYPSAFKKISSLGVEQQRVTVVVSFDPAGTRLGDRYRVDVRVIFEEKANAILVPEAALFRTEGEWRAFRIEGGRARQVAIKTGIRDGRNREVLEGLNPGDEVILHPASDLEDGTRISGGD